MIHHVYANRSNVGDWLSARGIQRLLRPHEVTEYLCDEPFVPETLERLEAASPDDLIVIGGGGLFMDYFAPFWESFRRVADRVPFCIWGAGFCDLKREPSRPPLRLLEEIVARSRLCVVRDELTRDLLASSPLPAPVPCPSLCAVEALEQSGKGLLHVDNYTTAGADVFEAMDACGRRFAEASGRPYRRTNNRIPGGSEQALGSTLDLYAQCDLVLSSALHGCIIAVAMGRKVCAVSGDYKIESFMRAAGLGEWVCGQDEVEKVAAMLTRLSEQPNATDFLCRARRENEAVADRVLSLVSPPGRQSDEH